MNILQQAALTMLEEICKVSTETTAIRGARYTEMKLQANRIFSQLKNSQINTSAESFLRNVTKDV